MLVNKPKDTSTKPEHIGEEDLELRRVAVEQAPEGVNGVVVAIAHRDFVVERADGAALPRGVDAC